MHCYLIATIIILGGIPMSANIQVGHQGIVSTGTHQATAKEEWMDRFRTEAQSMVSKHHFYPAGAMLGLLNKYDASDLERIMRDFQLLKEQTFEHADKAKAYIVTTGGPGAGKSTYFESFKEEQEIKLAYIDPDRSCLLNMENTYKRDIASKDRSAQDAYTHWREASNFLANVYLAYALDQGYAVAHGSTMADPRSIDALKMIGGGYGYHRTLLHFTCEEDVRKASELKRREGGVIQCTEEDLVNKGKQFHERLEGYLAESEEIVFLYRTDMQTIVEYGRKKDKQMTFSNEDLRRKAVKEHDAVCGEGDWDKVIAQ